MEKWLEVTWSPAARAGHLTTALPFDLLTPKCLRQVPWAIFYLFSSVFFKKGKTGLVRYYMLQILSIYWQSWVVWVLGMPFSNKYYSFIYLTADFCRTAKLRLSFAAPSLRQLCALGFCSLNRVLRKASHMQGVKAHPPPSSLCH